jgi:hypothetical protein
MVHHFITDKHCGTGMHRMKSLDGFGRLLHRVNDARGRHNGSFQLLWCTHLPDLANPIDTLHEAMVHHFITDKHCGTGMHRMKSLDGFGRLLHRVNDARGRHNGSFQVVWYSHLPDLANPIDTLHEAMVHHFITDKHCGTGMHRMKSLDGFGRLLHRVNDARGRHNGSFQVVWCTHLPDLANPIDTLHEAMVHHFITDKHCVIDIHRMKSLDGFGRLLHRVNDAQGRHNGSSGPPTGPGGRPPGLFATHAQWAGGRPFRFSARAGWAGVVLRYMPGRAGGRSVFRPGARGRRPVFLKFYREPN